MQPHSDNSDNVGSTDQEMTRRITAEEMDLLVENYRLVKEAIDRATWIEGRVPPSLRPPSPLMRHQPPCDASEIKECLDKMAAEKDQDVTATFPNPFVAWRWREHNFNVVRQARATIDEVCRPYVKATTTDLPDELLLRIMGLVVDPASGELDKSCLKHCRLVCHRWCGPATEHLFSEVRVGMQSPSSLGCLETISRDPRMRTFVTAVRFDMYLYDEVVSADQWVWIAFLRHRLGQRIHPSLMGSWGQLMRLHSPDSVRDVLDARHQDYRRLQQDQAALFNDGFFERVAVAIAKMPRVSTFRFVDLGSEHERNTIAIPDCVADCVVDWDTETWSSVDYYATLYRQLTQGQTAYCKLDLASESESSRFILAMADALRRAGVFPHHIEMDLNAEASWFAPVSSEQHEHLLSWVKELTCLDFAARRSMKKVVRDARVVQPPATWIFAPASRPPPPHLKRGRKLGDCLLEAPHLCVVYGRDWKRRET
ncbi:hypothetical protein QBC34DRAFT_455284 [Podospora aff. communis PSN243]|uniref:F-box domain-containing protein n=1 Tax=Podospora aff. communis PSN243 TaxID=3040156 RepID=A0AAV9GVZ4_9PEZI|nr:hypothetical protein QBC34DRAFT_455284 [Podospora aff. communis PSN243]